MTDKSFRASDYLEHMIEAIDRIQTYIRGVSKDEFDSKTILQDAAMRNLGVLGEASKNYMKVAPQAAQDHFEVPFAKIYAMRNQLEHGYFLVDMEIVWTVVTKELPPLRLQLESLLRALAHPDSEKES